MSQEKFREAYNKFREAGLLDRLNEKYRDKPFFEEYKEEKNVIHFGSWLINILSVSLAFYFVFQLSMIFINNTVLSGVIAVICLSVWELAKRGFATKALKKKVANNRYSSSWGVVMVLVIGSMGFTYFGGSDLMEDFTYSPQITNIDSLANVYVSDIAALEKQKSGLVSQQNEKGQTYYKLIDDIAALDMSIAGLINEKNQAVKRAEFHNTKEKTAETITTGINGFWFGIGGAFLDILLLACLWFCEYYDNRSHTEFKALKKQINSVEITPTTFSGNAASDAPETETLPNAKALLSTEFEPITAVMPIAQPAGGNKPALFVFDDQNGTKKIRHYREREKLYSYLSEEQVKANVSANRGRVRTAKKIYTASKREEDKQTLERREKKYNYWVDLLGKF